MEPHGPVQYEPGHPVLNSGHYAAVTLAGHTLKELWIAGGSSFPPARTIAGPGVTVRYVLIERSTFALAP